MKKSRIGLSTKTLIAFSAALIVAVVVINKQRQQLDSGRLNHHYQFDIAADRKLYRQQRQRDSL